MKGRSQDQNGVQRPKLIPFQPPAPYMVDDRWTQFKIVGKNIQSRSHHISVQYNNHLYVHGGYDADKGILSDFYKMDLNGKQDGFRWLAIPINDINYPGKLKSHKAVVFEDQLIIFGGQTIELKNTNCLWKFNLETQKWDKIQDNMIPRLDSHSVVIEKQNMFVYGGFIDNEAIYSSSIYKFNCANNKWEVVFDHKKSKNKFPEPRGSSTLVYYQNALWIFGGTNGDTTLCDIWRYNLNSSTWEQLKTTNTPEARRSHTMVLSHGYFWMFGGIQDVTKQKNDIYIFDPKKLEWTKIMNASNMVYQCSPTMKMQKNNVKRKDSPKKQSSKFSLGLSSSFNQKKEDGMKRILEQNRQKKFLEKKSQLLRQFVTKDNEKNERPERNLSPTSESMLKTLEVIGDQQHSKKNFHNEIVYDPSLKFIVGKKPCARDAHVTLIYKDKMLIFGGDRHLMSFADLFFFDIKKGMESRQLYKKSREY